MDGEENTLCPGTVTFAGAGPGAVDLLTIRCRDAIAEADVIIYAGSLVNPDVLQFSAAKCVTYDSASKTLPELVDIMFAAANENKKVLRLHTGDPSIYGAVAEQMKALQEKNIAIRIIPGVTSVSAAAAEVGTELTMPGVSQTLMITRRAGRTPVPDGEALPALAQHQASMDIADKTQTAGITRQAIVLVGKVLGDTGEASRLYAPDFSHGYRSVHEDGRTDTPWCKQTTTGKAAPESEEPKETSSPFRGNLAVYAITEAGTRSALTLAHRLGAVSFVPSRCRHVYEPGEQSRSATNEATDSREKTQPFETGAFSRIISENWEKFDGHVFIMAAGIVVRQITPFLKGKTVDPAVVVCDEQGDYAISLLSGHIGGANRLASTIAEHMNGTPVITTATDTRNKVAFDDAATRNGWIIENPAQIKELNSLLLEGKMIAAAWPPTILQRLYSASDNVTPVSSPRELSADTEGMVTLDWDEKNIYEAQQTVSTARQKKVEVPVLRMRRPGVVVGIGCHRGTSASTIGDAVSNVLARIGLTEAQVRKLASAELKKNETGLLQYAREQNIECEFFSSETLQQTHVPSGSETVNAVTGTPSVAEAAALRASGGKLIVHKQKCGDVTVAVATIPE